MLKLCIQDQALCENILKYVINLTARGEYHRLGIHELTEEQLLSLDKLTKLSCVNFFNFTQSGEPKIEVTIDMDSLKAGFNVIANFDSDSEIIQTLIYYIENGATKNMLYQLFQPPLKDDILEHWLSRLNVARKSGRSALPNDATRSAIQVFFHKASEALLSKGMNSTDLSKVTRTALRQTHEHFNKIPLDSLYATVNEFNTKSSDKLKD